MSTTFGRKIKISTISSTSTRSMIYVQLIHLKWVFKLQIHYFAFSVSWKKITCLFWLHLHTHSKICKNQEVITNIILAVVQTLDIMSNTSEAKWFRILSLYFNENLLSVFFGLTLLGKVLSSFKSLKRGRSTHLHQRKWKQDKFESFFFFIDPRLMTF